MYMNEVKVFAKHCLLHCKPRVLEKQQIQGGTWLEFPFNDQRQMPKLLQYHDFLPKASQVEIVFWDLKINSLLK